MSRRWTKKDALVIYASGGFGLGSIVQIFFLVPLRSRKLGASLSDIGLLTGLGATGPIFF